MSGSWNATSCSLITVGDEYHHMDSHTTDSTTARVAIVTRAALIASLTTV
jgi:hypothetical protein